MSPDCTEGEGLGEGENAALVVIPFTLCSVLFYRDRTRERARGAHRPPPGDPGSRPGKSPLTRSIRLMPSDFRVGDQPASLQAIPSAHIPAGGPGQPPTPHRFSAGPCHRCHSFILITRCYRCKTSYDRGFLSPPGEGIRTEAEKGIVAWIRCGKHRIRDIPRWRLRLPGLQTKPWPE